MPAADIRLVSYDLIMSDFKYKAFITYSHNDEGVVQWLHRQLERYRVPRKLRAEPRNQRLGRVFRDRDELGSAASLTGKISDALANSEFLIVVCSKRLGIRSWRGHRLFCRSRPKRADAAFAPASAR